MTNTTPPPSLPDWRSGFTRKGFKLNIWTIFEFSAFKRMAIEHHLYIAANTCPEIYMITPSYTQDIVL